MIVLCFLTVMLILFVQSLWCVECYCRSIGYAKFGNRSYFDKADYYVMGESDYCGFAFYNA